MIRVALLPAQEEGSAERVQISQILTSHRPRSTRHEAMRVTGASSRRRKDG